MPPAKRRFTKKRKVHQKTTEGKESQRPTESYWYTGFYEMESESADEEPYHVVIMKIAPEKLARFPVGMYAYILQRDEDFLS